VERKQWHVYITQPNECGELFKSYRMCFGKIIRIGTRSDAIKEIKDSKYCKISSNNWSYQPRTFDAICAGGEYDGYHPLSELEFMYITGLPLTAPLPDFVIERLQNFEMVQEYSRTIPFGDDWTTNIPITDFRKIVRYTNDQKKCINKINAHLAEDGGENQDFTDKLNEYRRYGDIMEITCTILKYMSYIKHCENVETKSDTKMRSIIENNKQLSEIKDKVKLLTIAKNMLPTKLNMKKMADIICKILIPARVNVTMDEYGRDIKYEASITSDEREDDMKQAKARMRGEQEYNRLDGYIILMGPKTTVSYASAVMAILNARLAGIEKIIPLPTQSGDFIHQKDMWEEIRKGYISDEENEYR